MTSPFSSDEDAGALAQAPPLRVRIRPVSGAQILGWLLHVDRLPERDGIRLESFAGDTAVISIDSAAFGALIPLLAAGEQPPAIELLPVRAPLAVDATPPSQPSRAPSPAGTPPPKRSRRLLRIAVLVAAAALVAAAGFAAGRLFRDRAEGNSPADPPLGDVIVTVAPIPTAAPTPAAPPRARVARDLTGACIPVSGASQCDA
ncbi:MAG: hypothetical protein ACRDJ9_36760, partial [Dehalococcoidia bacterium]